MEVLLTLESVVVNLAECLKNSDLMAALTRYAKDYFLFVWPNFLCKQTETVHQSLIWLTGRPRQTL